MSWIDVDLPEIELSFSVNHQNKKDKTVRLTTRATIDDTNRYYQIDEIFDEKDEMQIRIMSNSEAKKKYIIETILRQFESVLRKTINESIEL